jgi:glycine dehydrogenase
MPNAPVSQQNPSSNPLNHSSSKSVPSPDPVPPEDTFLRRHLGSNDREVAEMLDLLGYESLDSLINTVVPASIRLKNPLRLPAPLSESEVLKRLRQIASQNKVYRSFLGMGYHDCLTPAVIQRNILENPGWYTAYTPYQAEISQGRLEALLNFQTMVTELTGMEIANASMLDEATAAAEAMTMCFSLRANQEARTFLVSESCHPQTLDVVRTRANPLGIKVVVGNHAKFEFQPSVFGILLQYPSTEGRIFDYKALCEQAHQGGAKVVVAADLLSLVLLRPPGEFGADVAVGSAQRFGVPLGYGGPHAGFFATKDSFKRQMPGRLVGVSHDAQGKPAYRLALQTREQHIRREKATSNICTAQVLLAVIASMYAVYHGPEGLVRIARRVHRLTRILAAGLKRLGIGTIPNEPFFDTLQVGGLKGRAAEILGRAEKHGMNLRQLDDSNLVVALDETTGTADIAELLAIFNGDKPLDIPIEELARENPTDASFPEGVTRQSAFLKHPVFNTHHTETEMLRYMRRLESRDVSLTHSMIPLGSCTMKLNATVEMQPVTWPEFSRIHPFAPRAQAAGYAVLFKELEQWLAEITGFPGISLQPNAGSQGEYAGLLAIRDYLASKGQGHRNVCLIPQSAHGTNPASAALAGFRVVPVACCPNGDISLEDLVAKAQSHSKDLALLMVTYPSTHGVFEETIKEVCETIHQHGGQVYMDGANMNAQVGLTSPAEIGADVCHLNLHKTFCIPHGGGGPGMGPIGVAAHLIPFLPGHPIVPPGDSGSARKEGAVSAAPWGSASILTISWVYIAMLGGDGLTQATKFAILNANYIARQLDSHFPVLYKGKKDLVAHECILDVRQWKATAGVEVEDIAKRLMDYGFHAPTISFPVPGTLMVEPTESESKEELDRFCDSMIAIHNEIQAIASGEMDRQKNVLKLAPHTAQVLISDTWDRPYSREMAGYPTPWTRHFKFWPVVGRIDNVHGDRNLMCACPPVSEYAE